MEFQVNWQIPSKTFSVRLTLECFNVPCGASQALSFDFNRGGKTWSGHGIYSRARRELCNNFGKDNCSQRDGRADRVKRVKNSVARNQLYVA
jgi:hypothetical protein